MHPSVSEAWPAVAREHEGVLPFMYRDSKGLVTAGIGTLLDDGKGRAPASCLTLPWTDGGHMASQVQIITAWDRVKTTRGLEPREYRDVTTLRLSDQVINGLLTSKTLEFWSVLASQLPGLEEWPADAQLGLIDNAYQLGPHFLGPDWPNFTAAAHARDFNKCADNCSVRQASPARNSRRQRLYRNAATVVALHIDPAILWDKRDPIKEDEDMPISDEDITRIAKAVKAEVLRDIAAAVWTADGADLIPAPDNLDRWKPATYLQRIYLAVKPKT